MAKLKRGGKPFVEEAGIVFSTEVVDEQTPGFRGEAEEGDLRPAHGVPKGSNVDDEAIGRSGRGGK